MNLVKNLLQELKSVPLIKLPAPQHASLHDCPHNDKAMGTISVEEAGKSHLKLSCEFTCELSSQEFGCPA